MSFIPNPNNMTHRRCDECGIEYHRHTQEVTGWLYAHLEQEVTYHVCLDCQNSPNKCREDALDFSYEHGQLR